MVIAGADVGVAAKPGPFVADDQRHLRVRLETGVADSDVRASTLELRRPMEVAFSSKRALSSMTHATCLPDSAALINERTKGVSSPTRYTVILIATVRGSSACVADEALDAVIEAVVGVMDEQVPGGNRLEKGVHSRPGRAA